MLNHLVWQVRGDRWPFALAVHVDGRIHGFIEAIPRTFAWWLPRKIVMWAVIRASTERMDVLQGNGSDTCMDVLKAWDLGPRR